MQIRVISYPEQRNTDRCQLTVSTCDEVLNFKTDGRLVANFRNKNESCLTSDSLRQWIPEWNFDLPFANTFDHGQVLVKISGNNPTPPQMLIYGIADTGLEIMI